MVWDVRFDVATLSLGERYGDIEVRPGSYGVTASIESFEGVVVVLIAHVCSRSYATAISFEVGRVTLCDDG